MFQLSIGLVGRTLTTLSTTSALKILQSFTHHSLNQELVAANRSLTYPDTKLLKQWINNEPLMNS